MADMTMAVEQYTRTETNLVNFEKINADQPWSILFLKLSSKEGLDSDPLDPETVSKSVA